MTTAHRATWKAARGGLQEEGSFRLHVPSAAVSSKDAPTERILKTRKAAGELSRGELRARLEIADDVYEQPIHTAKRARTRFAPLIHHIHDTKSVNSSAVLQIKDVDDGGGGGEGAEEKGGEDGEGGRELEGGTHSGSLKAGAGQQSLSPAGSDEEEAEASARGATVANGGVDVVAEAKEGEEAGQGSGGAPASDWSSDDEEDEDEDEDEEDEAELRAEVERIRKERALERAQRAAEEQERQQREEDLRISNGNPLLPHLFTSAIPKNNETPSITAAAGTSVGGGMGLGIGGAHDEISDTASVATGSVAFSVRRRWDDDVIFSHQAVQERRERPRFINDTIHNDFHRRFMKRFMK